MFGADQYTQWSIVKRLGWGRRVWEIKGIWTCIAQKNELKVSEIIIYLILIKYSVIFGFY